jgi:ubiquinone/menaquinone biosynthesis C-methylase UbiE
MMLRRKQETVDHLQVRKYYSRLAAEYNSLANQTCERVYRQLVQKHLNGCQAVMELGCGSSDLLFDLNPQHAIGCDLTLEMLRRRKNDRALKLAAAGEELPFRDSTFDAIFMVNVLEHVADQEKVLSECSRVLKKNGTWFAVTPNGAWEFWLDFAEWLRLKIPEGPHRFLHPHRLAAIAGKTLAITEHRTFLALPAGPSILSKGVDRFVCRGIRGGFFQYIVAQKK